MENGEKWGGYWVELVATPQMESCILNMRMQETGEFKVFEWAELHGCN